jgi:release factor glutamine methyltransferase
MVYEPREDSFLLEEHVQKRARGRVLDMGTGSGVQAVAVGKNPSVTEIIATDIDAEAVEFVKSMGIKALKSNLFEKINGKFDFIMFNPPYLPDHPKVKDVALDGGPTGRELLDEFLEQAPEFLKEDGEIIFVQSSVTGIPETKKKLEELGFENSIIARQKIPWEELVVFSCRLKQ